MDTDKNPYENQKPNDEQVMRIENLRAAFKKLDLLIGGSCPASRYRSLAITALEESLMWAVKSIVFE
jgi:hypothetical protein